jgi:hypothetical protein
MAKTTQSQRIVNYVKTRKTPATVPQIVKATNISVTVVRARIAEIVRQGTLQARPVNTADARVGYTI